jgi:DNA-binding IclR family transcriptional regulator
MLTDEELAGLLDISLFQVRTLLKSLESKGLVKQLANGEWDLTEKADDEYEI